MVILLFDSAQVKRIRPRQFGRGILAYRPIYRSSWTADDERWLVEDRARRENQRLEREAGASAYLDSVEFFYGV